MSSCGTKQRGAAVTVTVNCNVGGWVRKVGVTEESPEWRLSTVRCSHFQST